MITTNEPVDVRVDIGEACKGTLSLKSEGLGYKIPRGKKDCEILIPWDKLQSAFALLENVPGFTIPVKETVEGLPIQDSRFRTPDSGFPIQDSRFRTPDSGETR